MLLWTLWRLSSLCIPRRKLVERFLRLGVPNGDGDGATACGVVSVQTHQQLSVTSELRLPVVVIEVVTALPFIYILWTWQQRVKKVEEHLPRLPAYSNFKDQLFHDYDIIGSALFVGAIALILVPLSMAGGTAANWTADKIGMMCTGFACLILFTIWSLPRSARPSWLFRPRFPLIPWHILKNPSVLAMFIVNLFDFMSYGMFSIYFQSYLQVAVQTSPAQAGQIDNTVRIVFQVVAVITGLLMRFWTPLCQKVGLGKRLFHTRYPIICGIPLCSLAMALEIDFVQNPTRSAAVAQFVIARGLYGIGRGVSRQMAVC